ncbi:NAD(P)/FAD-dependent oxidoreductase [Spelaeicoccus albus]|uniref:Sarcosine oxidase subunit beta n=1 Tax=Spelaeicoccus albus TaxID=1280376 RepID=A0A7Z0A9V1_9MICO|nr:FAD-binding oxidoreductase [Spelaeicoccus albus]NYI67087.1 sarcosine oxidase subunit beta [Spelaeicoccus albus]
MAEAIEIVVVGGGVIGTSIAFHLARLGVTNVTLIERGAIAGGASGQSGALVRSHYPDSPEAQVAWAAVPWFEEWAERVGGDCGFRQTGFLQLVHKVDKDLLEKNVARLQAIGVETQLVTAADARRLQPGLAIEDDEYAAYEQRSGYADPVATAQGFAAAAQRLGADIRTGESVRNLIADGTQVTGVVTSSGSLHAGVVILANGSWSAALARTVGVEIPIELVRGQAAIVSRPPTLPGVNGHLAIIDRRSGIYARPSGEHATLVGLSRGSTGTPLTSAEGVTPDRDFPETARAHLARTLPGFSDSTVQSAQAGPLDMTPDRCCVLGKPDGVSGLALAVGMSGSGFKKSPAIGACMAELIVNGKAETAPIDAFRLERFSTGSEIQKFEYLVGDSTDRGSFIH